MVTKAAAPAARDPGRRHAHAGSSKKRSVGFGFEATQNYTYGIVYREFFLRGGVIVVTGFRKFVTRRFDAAPSCCYRVGFSTYIAVPLVVIVSYC